MKTNEHTVHGRLLAAVETSFEIPGWLFGHAAGLGMSRTVDRFSLLLHDPRFRVVREGAWQCSCQPALT